MQTLITFIVGVAIGYLLLVASHGSFAALLNSIFLLTLIIAFGIFLIYKIGNRLQKLLTYIIVVHDTTIISAVPDSRTNAIKLCALGQTQLYLRGYELPGHQEMFDRSRLIPSVKDNDSYYWLPSPEFKMLNFNESFVIKLFVEDSSGNRWISEHSGVLEQHPYQDGAFVMRIWSYKLEKEN